MRMVLMAMALVVAACGGDPDRFDDGPDAAVTRVDAAVDASPVVDCPPPPPPTQNRVKSCNRVCGDTDPLHTQLCEGAARQTCIVECVNGTETGVAVAWCP